MKEGGKHRKEKKKGRYPGGAPGKRNVESRVEEDEEWGLKKGRGREVTTSKGEKSGLYDDYVRGKGRSRGLTRRGESSVRRGGWGRGKGGGKSALDEKGVALLP